MEVSAVDPSIALYTPACNLYYVVIPVKRIYFATRLQFN